MKRRKHTRYQQQMQQQTLQKAQQPPLNNKLLISIGIAGIILIVGVLFFVQRATSSSLSNSNSGEVGNVNGAEQVIKMAVNNYQYEPSTLTVQAGKPVKWIIDGTGAVGCSSYLTSPQLGVSKRLSPGENIIQFIAPTQKGTYGFSCSMGMVKGTMNVV